jgi:2,3-bisphosphoglycerate-independent phosphoglycerate mutase
MKTMRKTVVLVILDGWGIGREDESNPLHFVKPANLQFLKENFPVTSLVASGIAVGLPWGETGNSEVGHLTLGAGKVLYQYYPKITLAIRDKSFFENPNLVQALAHAKKNKSAVNFAGLLSKGNVHASLEHLLALIQAAKEAQVDYKLHLFADGKDMPPGSILSLLKEIPPDHLSTLTGRYYAMDREENWNLVQAAYDCLVSGKGKLVADAAAELGEFLKSNQSEEFLPPTRFGGEEKNIKDGDSLVFFNFREDSIREIASSFMQKDFSSFPRENFKDLHLVSMTPYSDKFQTPVLVEPDRVEHPLGQVLAEAEKSQLRLAETYKYAHITYFFNGFREAPFPNEYRVIIPSEPIPHPDEHPEMAAPQITERLLSAMNEHSFDFILVNYANPDAIAHTGNFEAGLQTIKIMDEEIGKILKAMNEDVVLIITSDHGNIEEMVNPISGRKETQHDPNPVPFYLVGADFHGRKFDNYSDLNQTSGILSDVAPTILEIMGLAKPEEMNGESLLGKLI